MKTFTGEDFSGLTLLGDSRTPCLNDPADARLETFSNQSPQRGYEISFDCPEFTSVCPVTGQPDFGRITISYVPDKLCIESKSLKIYLLAFRNYPSFHEAVVNRVLDDLLAACHPRRMTVLGDFRPRGGISIRVKAEYSAADAGDEELGK